MYFLDTDTLSLAHAGHAGIARRIQQAGEENVATTIINAVEILQGRHEFLLKAADGEQLLRAQQWLVASQELLETIHIVPVDMAAAAQFDRLRQDRKLKKVQRADLLIACITLAHRATLVTRNLKDFQQVAGLQVENWAA